jgi:hypothetical protein
MLTGTGMDNDNDLAVGCSSKYRVAIATKRHEWTIDPTVKWIDLTIRQSSFVVL